MAKIAVGVVARERNMGESYCAAKLNLARWLNIVSRACMCSLRRPRNEESGACGKAKYGVFQ